MSSGLPSCKDNDPAYWHSFYNNCTENSPLHPHKSKKERKALVSADCCDQITCRDPWNIGLTCPKPKHKKGEPYFGDIRPEERHNVSLENHPSMGVM